MKKILVSVLGEDKPGILAAISTVLTEKECNIENISQTLLQSIFGALIIVSIPDKEEVAFIKQALKDECEDFNLQIHVDFYSEKISVPELTEDEPYIITAIGPDRKGVVSTVTQCLLQFNINVSNLHAVFKGGDRPLDNLMIFEVDVPVATKMLELNQALKKVADVLSLEVNLQHRKIFKTLSRIKN